MPKQSIKSRADGHYTVFIFLGTGIAAIGRFGLGTDKRQADV